MLHRLCIHIKILNVVKDYAQQSTTVQSCDLIFRTNITSPEYKNDQPTRVLVKLFSEYKGACGLILAIHCISVSNTNYI